MMRVAVLALLLVAGTPGVAAPTTWQAAITAPDRSRLAKLWDAWTRALAEADASGQSGAIAALGAVGVPDAATMNRNAADPMTPAAVGALPAPGTYRCRTITLGTRAGGVAPRRPATVGATPFAPCRIEARDTGLWFEQERGPAQRLGGQLHADGARMVFLGTTALAGETGILVYGADPERNAVGALRAIGDGHWRLELPWPNWQSNLGIVEIVME